MTVNLDAVILDEPSIVEAKNTGWYQAGEWSTTRGKPRCRPLRRAGPARAGGDRLDSCWFSVLIVATTSGASRWSVTRAHR